MGQAKQRGTFEERLNAAVARGNERRVAADIGRHKPSQKNASLIAIMTLLMLPNRGRR